MKKRLILLIGLVTTGNAFADMQAEIDHLLNYVANTNCQYERNGTMHKGEEAVAHIKKKYDYFIDDIESTEDFIKYSATKSKMSGKYYLIHCPEQTPIKSKYWLLAELAKYRKE
ncbi:DUF5329 family protein [Catenovulum agarivorans]|uniref:DUF5329 family protein n=1 Tax=Catenovulum agarivorans TaxID=1172192 RepID=UPI000311450D|nr:DUF5329 family protein [Catenovulum agarivorans]